MCPRITSSGAFSASVLGGGAEGRPDPVEEIGRLGARLILQQALEDEVTEFLGRVRYERTGEPVSHRNGYCRPRLSVF